MAHAGAPPPPDVLDPRVVRTRRDVLDATVHELVEGGWDAVTHARVAARAGYSKATLYAHWPDRLALVSDAFAAFGGMPHHEATGDLRTDLLGELVSFRTAMVEHRLDRALVVLAERVGPVPELTPVRDAFVDVGERPMREALAEVLQEPALGAVTAMLCGAVVHPVLLRGHVPSDDELAVVVDVVMAGLPSVAGPVTG